MRGDIVRDIIDDSIVGIVRYGEYRNAFGDDKNGGYAGFYVEWKNEQELLRKDLVFWAKKFKIYRKHFRQSGTGEPGGKMRDEMKTGMHDVELDHDLKILPKYFEAVISGRKKFEIRKNDRDYKEGDLFILREYEPGRGYTGRDFIQSIGYIMKDCPEYGLMDGYIVFGW